MNSNIFYRLLILAFYFILFYFILRFISFCVLFHFVLFRFVFYFVLYLIYVLNDVIYNKDVFGMIL
ncbi:hypothetical protein MmiHf6_07160 [Methanimicrococcus hongohii]|uniref:Uncharacterized protein n=1 Tax=Methanimicrococcus hongohii TaxID=3028295 RepID=A0AA96UZ75_9EURY|nr:hypothetical protein MmiHf6_07160 [Methanimicrococcus sp. Hf6]